MTLRKTPKRPLSSSRKRRWRPTTRAEKFAVTFLAIVGALGIAALLFSLGRVELVVQVRAVPVRADFDVTVVSGELPRERELPGRVVTVDGTASVTVPVGEGGETIDPASLPPRKATGTVILMSTHSADQALVATTRLLSPDGVLFRLDRAAVVPARGKVEGVAVTADAVGAQGNLGPGKFTIPGLSPWMQQRIWAESVAAMVGGQGSADGKAAVPVHAVTQEVLDRAAQEATTRAQQDFDARAQAFGDRITDVHTFGVSTVVEQDAKVGDVRETVTATVVVSGKALVLPGGDLTARAQEALTEAARVQGRTLLRVHDDALQFRVVSSDERTGRTTVTVTATGDGRIGPTLEAFDVSRITGFTSDDVRTYLQSIPGVEDVQVTLWPSWVDTVPANGTVEVEVRELE
ncbi:MAG: hypothetical protein Q7T01_01720 [bacterium]|nr:hypothetical protein [bacterium]